LSAQRREPLPQHRPPLPADVHDKSTCAADRHLRRCKPQSRTVPACNRSPHRTWEAIPGWRSRRAASDAADRTTSSRATGRRSAGSASSPGGTTRGSSCADGSFAKPAASSSGTPHTTTRCSAARCAGASSSVAPHRSTAGCAAGTPDPHRRSPRPTLRTCGSSSSG